MARPAVSYRALALGADERAIGVIAGVYALLPLFAAVPLGRRTDHGRCAPLLPVGVVLISGGCALSGTGRLAAGDGRLERGDGPRPPLLRHRRPVARRPPVRARTNRTATSATSPSAPPSASWSARSPPGALIRRDGRHGRHERARPARRGRRRGRRVHLAVAHRAPRRAAKSRTPRQGDRRSRCARILRTRGVPGRHLHQPGRAVRDRHPHRLPPGGRRAPGHRPLRHRPAAQPARGGHHRLPAGDDAADPAAGPHRAAGRDAVCWRRCCARASRCRCRCGRWP